ncbi:hypothetical protein FNV43_RR07438 [Rhamnella rubrinervis]|uniref:Uncharacterized protein n=1 Tax=Rhamnella rubrinervis TaxID=2594499 RepID=A0A8K0MMQ5_9ROSA|nr:hypothetical protein FNV43_RR07438 [Rhamnella rubrinervis]
MKSSLKWTLLICFGISSPLLRNASHEVVEPSLRSWIDFEQVSNLTRCRGAELILLRCQDQPRPSIAGSSKGHDESLESYTKRFNNEAMLIEDFSDQMTIQVILNGLQPGAFEWDIAKNTPKTLSRVMEKA